MQKKFPNGKSTTVAAATILLIAGCVSNAIEGAHQPPRAWVQDYTATQCGMLSGSYADSGTPAADNAHTWLYNTVWPVAGSLTSILELGANAIPQSDDATVRIAVESSGELVFEARNAQGVSRALRARAWQCDKGALVSHVPLSNGGEDSSSRHDEAYLRLWKSADGGLIAEQTMQSVKLRALSDKTGHRPHARFYFHFDPRT